MTTRLFGVLLYAVMFSGLLGGMAFAQPLCSPVGVPERLISVDYNDEEVSYGTSVAISGNTLVIGTPNLDAQGSATFGGAYVYTRTSATAPWSLQATLVPSRVFSSESRWGVSVAIDGNTIAIAGEARFMDAATIVAVFTRAGSTWTQQARIEHGSSSQYHPALALFGNTLVFGHPSWTSDPSTILSHGAVYVYTRVGSAWSLQDRIDPPVRVFGGRFGGSVAIAGSTIAVGQIKTVSGGALAEPSRFGEVFVFTLSGSSWVLQQRVEPFDQYEHDAFGHSVALVGNTLLVGAPGDVNPIVAGDIDRGSAFVFTRSGTTWSQYSKINPIDSYREQSFGSSVALASEIFAAIGAAPGELRSTSGGNGEAYSFRLSGGLWLQQHRMALVPDTELWPNKMGTSVCVSGSASSATVVSGSPRAISPMGEGGGAVGSFATTAASWSQSQRLTEPGHPSDLFGSVVAMNDLHTVIGAADEDTADKQDVGAVRVKTSGFSGYPNGYPSGWFSLWASDGDAFDYFGGALAVSGSTIAVGASGDNNGNGANAGAVYIFIPGVDQYGDIWTEQTKIIAPDGAAEDRFGRAVGLFGNTLMVGAPRDDNGSGADAGAVYVFTRSGTTWTYRQKFGSLDLAAGDEFGQSIALSSFPAIPATTIAVVGAFGADVLGRANAGAAYVFAPQIDLAGTFWTEREKLIASDNAVGDNFGVSVAAASNGTVVVGALLDDNANGTDAGAAYVYVPVLQSISNWTQQVKLIAGVGLAGDRLGSSVAVQPGRIVAGAPLHGLFDEGGAFLFVRDNAVWRQRPPIYGINGVLIGDHFGSAVAMNSSSLLVGSPYENNENGVDAGAAYLYDFFICLADYNCSGSLSVQDLLDFLTGYFAQSSAADTNGSGTWTVQDIFDFLAGYFAGCS